MRQKNISLLSVCLSSLLTGCGVSPQPVPEHPNVIYVFPDQMRNHAMGFWDEPGFREKVVFRADPVYTPNLNAFAREALVLTSAVSNCPLSSPHRGSLLTGMYPNRSGVPVNCNADRPLSSLLRDADCISDVFSLAGYNCAYFGKLHVDHPTPNDPENPGHYVEARVPAWDAYTPPERRHRFDYWYSYGTFDKHKSPHYWDTQGKRHEVKEWSPKHEADKVIDYLRNVGNVRDTKKPFFMMVSFNPPHSPYNSLECCMEEDYNLYKDKPIDSLLVRPNADRKMKKASCTPYYFASVTGIDREFGRILAELKRQGLDKNTIVVFSSDHGETMCSQGVDDAKNSPYAESMNVPFLIRYPGHIAPRTDDLLLSTPDIMPTLLGLCDLKIPQTVQGTGYAGLFTGQIPQMKRPEGALYIKNTDGEKDVEGKVISYFPLSRGIKTERYTLALTLDKESRKLKEVLLYDDKNDPYQMNPLKVENAPETFNTLCSQMARLLKQADDPWYKEKILSNYIPYQ